MRDVLRNPVGAVDLRRPLRDAAEHPAIVNLLERFASTMSPPTCPTNTIIGVESCCAVWMPIAAFDAPDRA